MYKVTGIAKGPSNALSIPSLVSKYAHGSATIPAWDAGSV